MSKIENGLWTEIARINFNSKLSFGIQLCMCNFDLKHNISAHLCLMFHYPNINVMKNICIQRCSTSYICQVYLLFRGRLYNLVRRVGHCWRWSDAMKKHLFFRISNKSYIPKSCKYIFLILVKTFHVIFLVTIYIP